MSDCALSMIEELTETVKREILLLGVRETGHNTLMEIHYIMAQRPACDWIEAAAMLCQIRRPNSWVYFRGVGLHKCPL
jgi:hypothetical protein